MDLGPSNGHRHTRQDLPHDLALVAAGAEAVGGEREDAVREDRLGDSLRVVRRGVVAALQERVALRRAEEGLPGPLWIDPLKPGESREILVEGVFPRRGVVREADAGLLSRFPLGLFRKYRRATLARELVVYPLPQASRVPLVPPEDARGGRPHPRRRGGGSDIRTLRDFVPGDDPRDLHWKQSARMRHWIVREREAERDRAVLLAVDNGLADLSDPAALLALEERISRCAAQALLLLSRGAEVGFEARGVRVPPAAGRAQRSRILEALARLEAIALASAPAFGAVPRGDLRWQVM